MNTFKLNATNQKSAQIFLERYEETCVQLCVFVRKMPAFIWILSKKNEINSPDDIFGIIYCNRSLFHCLPFSVDEDAFQAINQIASEKNLFCIMGEKSATEALISHFSKRNLSPVQKNDCNLLIKTDEKNLVLPEDILLCDDEIIPCTMHHLDDLLDLHLKYLQEEVAPKNQKISPSYAKTSLTEILRQQMTMAVLSDDMFVAKANTNAIGWNWIQLGGVYTHPLYRKNGYAKAVVSSLCKKILQNQKKICLFVNKINTPAQKLYDSLGFVKSAEFEIAYYN